MNQRDLAPAPRMWRWIGGLGIVFAVLYALAFTVLSNGEPGIKASPARLVSYYVAHNGSATFGVLALVVASVAFVFFSGAVRDALAPRGTEAGALPSVSMVGAAVFASGLLLMAALRIALLDAASNRQPDVARVLNYLGEDAFFPAVAGLAIFMLATGIAILRTLTLPAWLGWFAVVIGVLAIAGPLGQIAFLVAPVWVLVAGLLLLGRRPDAGSSEPSLPAAQMTPSG